MEKSLFSPVVTGIVPANVPPAYLAQLALYRALLRQVYPDRVIRAALLWTAAPRLMAIPDDVLDLHLP